MAFCFSCASDENEFCFDKKGQFSYLGQLRKQDNYTCERKCSVMIDEFNMCRHSKSWVTVHLTIGGKMYTYDICLHSTVYLDVSINCSAWEIDVMATVMVFCFSCASDEKFNHEFCFDKKRTVLLPWSFQQTRKCSVMIDEFNMCRHSNSWITVHLTIGGKMYTYDICLHSTVYLDVSINCSAWEIENVPLNQSGAFKKQGSVFPDEDGQCNCRQGPRAENSTSHLKNTDGNSSLRALIQLFGGILLGSLATLVMVFITKKRNQSTQNTHNAEPSVFFTTTGFSETESVDHEYQEI
uniref:Uncharacterized protein LOC111115859 n=1 Tax=Crassostrea virginica TaxID=6565 RepID=A0A8B8C4D7_CRAVI|nr:uncharacterized protein LOC111115859 [Crassostrea virginica]